MEESPIEKLKLSVQNNKLLSFIVQKLKAVSSEKLKTKIINIVTILNSESIDFATLHKYVFDGLPDDIPSLRSLIWKLLLNNINLNSNEWESSLTKTRVQYEKYSKKYIKENNFSKNKDHPLSLVPNSDWNKYFKDAELYEEITKDIRRTRTHMNFFFMPCKATVKVTNEQITKAADSVKNEHISHILKKGFETNADVMTRILFIYGKLHPDVKYVQGMNELLAPIFYCFSHDQNPFCEPYLEADAFTCFENLMNDIKDVFIRGKDKTANGIESKMKTLETLLKFIDYDVYNKLTKENIEMHFYAFRWFTLFFTQDYEMPDILRLWDSILSEDDIFDFINMIILTILRIKRNIILENEFSGIMMQLQDLVGIEVEQLVRGAIEMRNDLNKKV